MLRVIVVIVVVLAAFSAAVATTQIAPTILKVLGLNPHELEAVNLERTKALPDFD